MDIKEISVLCIDKNSNYKLFDNLDLWDKERDAYNFNSQNYVIAHPPCQQWSRLKSFAKNDIKEKELAFFCFEKVKNNGGIFEHPYGSSFFKYIGIKPTITIDMNWLGFKARKRTYLYYEGVRPGQFKINFDLPENKVCKMNSRGERSITPVEMINFLLQSFKNEK